MFEKIGQFADTLATSAGQSRRGFLGCLGKGALGRGCCLLFTCSLREAS